MTQTTIEMDIHNMERRYGNAVRNLLGHQRIPHCQAQNLSLARRLFYLQRLTIIAATLGEALLVDLRLPDMDGIELLTAMRDTTPKIVKIIITGYPSLENAIEAVNRGADGYMVKPYSMEKLLDTVEEHLQRQREEQRFSEEKVKEFTDRRAEIYESRTSAKHRSKK